MSSIEDGQHAKHSSFPINQRGSVLEGAVQKDPLYQEATGHDSLPSGSGQISNQSASRKQRSDLEEDDTVTTSLSAMNEGKEKNKDSVPTYLARLPMSGDDDGLFLWNLYQPQPENEVVVIKDDQLEYTLRPSEGCLLYDIYHDEVYRHFTVGRKTFKSAIEKHDEPALSKSDTHFAIGRKTLKSIFNKHNERTLSKSDKKDIFLPLGWLVENKGENMSRMTRYVCLWNISTRPMSLWLAYDYLEYDEEEEGSPPKVLGYPYYYHYPYKYETPDQRMGLSNGKDSYPQELSPPIIPSGQSDTAPRFLQMEKPFDLGMIAQDIKKWNPLEGYDGDSVRRNLKQHGFEKGPKLRAKNAAPSQALKDAVKLEAISYFEG